MFGFYPCQFNSNSMGVFFWHQVKTDYTNKQTYKKNIYSFILSVGNIYIYLSN